jgi:small-conductance mechanosensitive channel
MDWDTVRAVLSQFGETLSTMAWAPSWLVGLALLPAAILAALAVHRVVFGLIRRAIRPRQVFVGSLLAHTAGPTRLALAILALNVTLQAAPFDVALVQAINHVLLIALTLLLGWIAVIAVRIAADLYLRRFQIDAEDNLLARTHVTQVRILERAADTLAIVITAAFALMTFEPVRQYGVSLFASAGIAGLAVGLAARPLLSNLIAGVQIAMTQPIRIGDAVVVEHEFGWIEEIAATYVVIKVWDERRLVVPLNDFIEKPFQNWTRRGSALIGSVLLRVDFTAPIERMRAELQTIASRSKLWDGRVVNLQVTDCGDATIELRALVSARTAPALWDLRCEVREKLIAFLGRDHPGALPRRRAELALDEAMVAGMRTAERTPRASAA